MGWETLSVCASKPYRDRHSVINDWIPPTSNAHCRELWVCTSWLIYIPQSQVPSSPPSKLKSSEMVSDCPSSYGWEATQLGFLSRSRSTCSLHLPATPHSFILDFRYCRLYIHTRIFVLQIIYTYICIHRHYFNLFCFFGGRCTRPCHIPQIYPQIM